MKIKFYFQGIVRSQLSLTRSYLKCNLMAVAFLICTFLLNNYSAFAQLNLALGKPAYASNTWSTFLPSNAFDGNATTNWNAGNYPLQWIAVDLGSSFEISSMKLRVAQQPPGTTTHKIYFSADGINWGTAVDIITGYTISGDILTRNFTSGSARYIKVETTLSPSWVAWFEIEVYGVGAALNFDGSNDWVQIPFQSDFNVQKFTVEGWVKPTSGMNPWARLWGTQNNKNDLVVKTAGVEKFSFWPVINGNFVSAEAPTNWTSGQWYHIAGVVDGSFVRLYVNGVEVASTPYSGTVTSDNGVRYIGRSYSASEIFKGNFDEVRFWKRALCQSEIQNNMNCEIPTSGVGLVANYHFNQGYDGGNNPGVTTLVDASGNSNNGSLLNFALTGITSNWIAPGGVITGTNCTPYIDDVAPTITCSINITANNIPNLCSANISVPQPTVSDPCNPPGIGHALDFDGLNDYVIGPNDVVPVTGEYTVSVWAKQENNHAGSFREIFAQGRNLYLGQSNFGIIRVGDSWINTGVPFPTDNQWHHYAVVRKINNTHLYIDGALVASKGSSIPSPGINPPWPHNFMVGSQWQPGEIFDGPIDEIQIWNYALEQKQISCNMNQRLVGNEVGLVAYYNFEDGTGSSTLTDIVNSSHNGSLTNMNINNAWIVSTKPAVDINIKNSFNNTCDASGTYPVGITNVIWTATDAAGNTATCNHHVTVSDNQMPIIVCPSDIEVSNEEGICGVIVEYIISSSDNCPDQNVTQTDGLESGSMFPVGITTNSFVVTDASNNTNVCSFTVTVNDSENPTIDCPDDITVNNDPYECGAIVEYTINSDDNCPDQNVTQTEGLASGLMFPVGTTTNSFTVTDASSNTAICSFTVTVIDNTDPGVECVSHKTRFTDAPTCTYTAIGTEFDLASSGDNCEVTTKDYVLSGATTGSGSISLTGVVFNKGVTTVEWTVSDAAGNTAACSFTVTVNDDDNPSVSCIANTSRTTNAGTCTYTTVGTEFDPLSISDNCAVTSTAYTLSGATIGSGNTTLAGVIFKEGITSVQWKVSDAAGNMATCSFTVSISGPDDDCDGVGNACDVCPGGDDKVDNNHDGLPDCNYLPAYADIIAAWKCGANKVYVCHIPPGNPANKQTICVSYNAVQAHLTQHGDYIGQCGNANCGSSIEGNKSTEAISGEEIQQSHSYNGGVIIYPNPVQNILYIKLMQHTHAPVLIQLYNGVGQELFNEKYVTNEQLESIIPLSTENYASGLYFIKVTVDGNEQLKTFSILK